MGRLFASLEVSGLQRGFRRFAVPSQQQSPSTSFKFIGDLSRVSTAIKDLVEIMADVCILECGLTILPNFLILKLLPFTKFANRIT
jgi:hypothetical protein